MNNIINLNDLLKTNLNTTILCSSKYNYTKDIIELTNEGCETITKTNIGDTDAIPNKLLKLFNSEYLKKKKNPTKIDEIKINILNALTSKKEVFVFFNVLTYLDTDFKKQVINYLLEHNKTIINFTTDIEETLLLDYLVVIHENKIIMEGPTKEVLQEEKILKKLGFNLPFIVELSIGLKYYNLTNKIYFDNESLVSDLWK